MPLSLEDGFQRSWEHMAAVYAPDDPLVDTEDPRWLREMAAALSGVADAAQEIEVRQPPRSLLWRLAFCVRLWANEKRADYELRSARVDD